ncbi:LOW QUALITY PROTEIN: apolipoprotein M [Eleginops maclovinus]|uniref:LOW QUALITY PROTEIN: apolipoprotein M n=1 Tax=Eleginops maclovinus TaxID=56733 RepID=UPI00307FCF9B
MLVTVLSYFLCSYGLLYHAFVPCSVPEQLRAHTVNHQQFLGKWFLKATVGRRETDILKFKDLDSMWISMEEPVNDTLLVTGKMRIGDDCITQTWTYHIFPDRDDVVLEGLPKRRTPLWSGKWANCSDCLIIQEVEPPLKETDTEDSLNRYLLHMRQSDNNPEVVKAFQNNLACHNKSTIFILPQEKEFCT